jgi:hypothetical protein
VSADLVCLHTDAAAAAAVSKRYSSAAAAFGAGAAKVQQRPITSQRDRPYDTEEGQYPEEDPDERPNRMPERAGWQSIPCSWKG